MSLPVLVSVRVIAMSAADVATGVDLDGDERGTKIAAAIAAAAAAAIATNQPLCRERQRRERVRPSSASAIERRRASR
jgi:hypothetical protein